MTKYLSETEMLIQGIYISSTASQIEADKLCNDSEPMQDYMRHTEQQSHGHKTQVLYRQLQFILRPLKIVHHSCKYTKHWKTFILKFVCSIAIIWSAFGLNSVHAHYFEET